MPEDWYDRLVARMDALGLSEAEVIRRAKLSGSWFTDRNKGKAQQPKIDTIVKLAAAVNTTVSELLGEGAADGLKLVVQHRIQANEMWADRADGKPKELPLSFLTQDLVSLEVETNDYRSSGYRRGDLVAGARTFKHIDNLIGCDCIVETTDGERLFKVLAKGSVHGRYTLKSFDPAQEDIDNARIKWVAPVTMIIRGMA